MSKLEKGEHYSETYGAARRVRLMAGVVDWFNKDSLAASERASELDRATTLYSTSPFTIHDSRFTILCYYYFLIQLPPAVHFNI
jgi:hypothetical protein